MRLVTRILIAAAAPALAAAPAAAAIGDGPVSTQPLARAEVLLELTAVGTARQRADLATFNLFVVCAGATEAEAIRLMEQRIAAIRAAARALGVQNNEIRVQGASTVDPADALEGLDAVPPEGAEAPTAGQQHAVRSRVEIRFSDIDRVSQFQGRLPGLGIADMGGPAYSLTNDREARRRAREDAMRTLRADAEAYGASLGLRVIRLVRVSERLGTDFFSLMAGNGPAAQRMTVGASPTSEVEVSAFVSADFALAPQ